MSMYTKLLKNKIITLGTIIILFWLMGNIVFFICSFTDFCLIKNPNVLNTKTNLVPKLDCKKHQIKGSSLLQLNRYTNVLVLTPLNHISNKKYPLLIVYAPSGKSAKKSERFYKKITSEFTSAGFIIAYINHLPLSERSINYNRATINLIKKNYCISDNINLLGHSDGATVAGIIAYREKIHKFNNIIISANGLNKEALSNEECPNNNNMSFLFLHNKNDRLFPGYGTENYNWLKHCFSCSKLNIYKENGCVIPENCINNKLQICYNNKQHKNWPNQNKIIANFLIE